MNRTTLASLVIAAATALTARSASLPFSDSFSRTAALPCALGVSDNSLGGTTRYSYSPIFPTGGTDAGNPVGAVISGGALRNAGLDFGGVQFSLSADPCLTRERGADMGQDLTIRVRLRVPSDSQNRVTYAGPYFRSRRAPAGDGIIGGNGTDPSGGYWVQLLSTGEIRVLRLDVNAVVASSGRPVNFDSSVFHKLEITVNGDLLQIALDGGLTRFNEPAGCALVATVPNTGIGNQGAAGLAFGTESRGLIGGQEADDLEVTAPASIAGFPVATTPALWIQSTNTITVRGNNTTGTANLIVCDLLNMGTLKLDSIESSWGANVRTAGYLTNSAGALIEILPGAGGPRTIFSDIFNFGTLRANLDLTLTKPFGLFLNQGMVDLSTNVTLSLESGGAETFSQSAGTLNFRDGSQLSGVGGTINITGGTIQIGANVNLRNLNLNYNGGQFAGQMPYLVNTKFQIAPAAGAASLLVVGVQDQLLGDLPAGQTLWVQGNNTLGSAALTATNGFANKGLLRLESIESSWNSGITLSSGTLTNALGATIHVGLGSFGPRVFTADILNQGTLNLQQSLDLAKPGGVFVNRAVMDLNTNLSLNFDPSGQQQFTQAAGTLTLRDGSQLSGVGGTINITGGTIQIGANVNLRNLNLNYNGGQFAGQMPYLVNTKFQIAPAAGAASLLVVGVQDQLLGDLPAGQTLWVQGNNTLGSAALVTTNGFANRGTLRIESIESSWNSALSLSSGVLTNAATGRIEVNRGSGGPRSLDFPIRNQGTIRVGTDVSLNFSQANEGTVQIQGGATVDVIGSYSQTAGETSLNDGTLRSTNKVLLTGGSLTGNGTVRAEVESTATIAPAGGTLIIEGKLTQGLGGTLAFRAKDSSAAGVDRLAVLGPVVLAGALRLDALPDFRPKYGISYALVNGAAITGTFTNISLPPLPADLNWKLEYHPTSVTLRTIRSAGTVAVDEGKVNPDGTFGFAFSGVLNASYSLEASTNLVNWIPLTNFIQTVNPIQIVDPGSTNFPRRFYRAIVRCGAYSERRMISGG